MSWTTLEEGAPVHLALTLVFVALLPGCVEFSAVYEPVDGGAAPAVDASGAPPTARYHPLDFATPAKHGSELAAQRQDCRTCHGDSLQGVGAAVSCDSCHKPGWRTNCTYCHGGAANTTGAPPRDLGGLAAGAGFPAHTAHVTGRITASSGCTQCHRRPTDVLSAGHAFDATAGRGEAVFTGGVSPATTMTATTCSNNYCHGNGRVNGTVSTAATASACSACHADATTKDRWGEMSGAHLVHLINPTIACADCHNRVVAADSPVIINRLLHIDGKRDVAFTENVTYDPATRKCTGLCHLFPHPGLGWGAP